MPNPITNERSSDVELVITRTFDAPPRLVFEAWTNPEVLKRWWTPKSFGITFLSCELDARTGGSYRFVFGMAGSPPMAFFGKYLEVVSNARLVWTNEEGGETGSVTTATFEAQGSTTLLTLRDRYPTKEALDAAIASGSVAGYDETFPQLDEELLRAAQ